MLDRDADLTNVKVKPDPEQDDNPANREFTVIGRLSGDNGNNFLVADLGEGGLSALVSEGFVRDNYVVDDSPDTDATDETGSDENHNPQE